MRFRAVLVMTSEPPYNHALLSARLGDGWRQDRPRRSPVMTYSGHCSSEDAWSAVRACYYKPKSVLRKVCVDVVCLGRQ